MVWAPFKLRGVQHWTPNLPQPLTQMVSFIYARQQPTVIFYQHPHGLFLWPPFTELPL